MNNQILDKKVDQSWESSEVGPDMALANDAEASNPKPSFLDEKLIDPFDEAKKKAEIRVPATESVPDTETTEKDTVPVESTAAAQEPELPEQEEPELEEKVEKEKTIAPVPVESVISTPEPESIEPELKEEALITPTPTPSIQKTVPISQEIPSTISDKEVKPGKQPAPIWKTVLKILLFFVGITLFIYFFINFSAYYERIKFIISPPKIETEIEVPNTNIIVDLPVTSGQDIYFSFLSTAFNQPIKYHEPQKTSEPEPQQTTSTGSNGGGGGGGGEIANNTLIIPRLGKTVPIVWNSPPDENVMLENLQNGVVHYAGTPLPGEGKGPIFISGHSSYYSWDPGKYKTVFTNLDRLSEGDTIQIKYNDQLYTYQVYESVVVMPEDVDQLTEVNEPILDLMTCVPIGTNQKRLIVKAKQI